jgi:dienelactone hydrolase
MTVRFRPLSLPIAGTWLEGDLTLPSGAVGLVVFAHGSGSSRASPRNRTVAYALQTVGLGTLLLDLLTVEEEAYDDRTGTLRFDTRFLGERLVDVCDWVAAQEDLAPLRLGLFGASTGAAAALRAAARRSNIAAVVSRGGRPDLAADVLAVVRAPTLFVVGGADLAVLGLNRAAFERLTGPKTLAVIPGASHLFEEPGALERVAELAGDWFVRFLGRAAEEQPSP